MSSDQAEMLRQLMAGKARQGSKKVVSFVPKEGLKVISIVGCKSGVGQGTVITNLALSLRAAGKQVLVIGSTEAVLKATASKGVHSISAGSVSPGAEDFLQRLSQVQSNFDVFLHEGGADPAFLKATGATTMIVATADPSSVVDAYVSIKSVLAAHPSAHFRVLVNKCQSSSDGETIFAKLKSVTDQFLEAPVDYAGCIMHDGKIAGAGQIRDQQQHHHIVPDLGYKTLAGSVVGESKKEVFLAPESNSPVVRRVQWREL